MNDFASLPMPLRPGSRLLPSEEGRRASALAALWSHVCQHRQLPFLLIAAFYLILPNLPLLLSAHVLGATPHGYINLEYLIIGVASVFLPRSAVFLLLAVDSLADLAYTICYAYQFPVGDLLSSVRYLPQLPVNRVLGGIAFLVLLLAICALLAWFRPRFHQNLRTAVTLLVLIALLTPIDWLSGQNPLSHRDTATLSFRIARSSVLTLLWRQVKTVRASGGPPNASERSASAQVLMLLDSHSSAAGSPNVVLVLVESWGLLRDPHLAQALAAPYDDPRVASRYKVSYGSVPFTGLTVPGEARELCHSTIGFGIIQSSTEHMEQCLPAYFHARGYQDLAIHGYVGKMFYRSTWYRNLGFDQLWFERLLKREGLPVCHGAFPGICDASIAHWIGSSLLSVDQQKPEFIYWVTLNSHIPVPAHPDLPDDSVCATQPALQNSIPLCSWFRLVRSVHQSVQQTALGATARPTIFILVGDHAPPFSDPKLRSQFSSTQVPYVMLTPVEIAAR